MAYTIDSKVREHLKGVQPQTTLDTINFDYYISKAENKINSKLASRYKVPFTAPVPPLIDDLTAEIAAYMVYKILNGTKPVSDTKSTVWYQGFEEAMKTLDAIAKYEEKLIDASGNDVAAVSGLIDGNNKSFTPACDMDDEGNWDISADQLDNISDRRD
jgi:phage gp36-like protein